MSEHIRNLPLKPNAHGPERYGLVLGGGGSKGCYHVGVWKAMNEAGIRFDALTGTSIGALVGIFYPGGHLDKVTDFVLTMEPDHIASELPAMPQTLKETVQESRTVLHFLMKYKDTRMDITPLREHFRAMFDYDSFAASPVKYACMTWNDTRQEPEAFFKGQIRADNAEEIVMASSACYPAFPKVTIDGQTYMDGMYADNVPIALLRQIQPEAGRIVVVDLHDPGEPCPPMLDDSMFYIQPLLKPGHPLDFTREHADRLYRQGYLETRKQLGMNPGYLYTFEEDDGKMMQIVENYMVRQFTLTGTILPSIPRLASHIYQSVLGYAPAPLASPWLDAYEFGRYIEALAFLAKVDPLQCWNYREFLETIVHNLASSSAPAQEDEFAFVELIAHARREESVWMFYRLIARYEGRLPERIAALKERFPVSYTLAYVRFFLEVLLAQLDSSDAARQDAEDPEEGTEKAPLEKDA